MAISTTTTETAVASNGVVTTFTAGFKVLDPSHMIVYHVVGSTATLKALTTDYTIPTYGAATTGVVFNSAPATGTVYMFLAAPFTQLARYVNSDKFPARSHEDALDKLTQLLQQTRDRTNRWALSEHQRTLGGAYIAGTSLLLPGPASWVAPVVAGRVYRIRIFGHAQLGSTGYGYRLRLTSADGGGGTLSGSVVGRALFNSVSGSSNGGQRRIIAIDGGDDSGFTSSPDFAGVGFWFDLEAIFRCSESGTVSTLFATTSGSPVTAQLNTGSTFTVEELPGASTVPALTP
jgi:hypothetical protein